MKKIFFLLTVLFATNYGVAQEIKPQYLKLKLSKPVKKASKKGNLVDAGIYWNKGKTNLVKMFLYTPKKSENLMMDVTSISENGTVEKTSTIPYSEDELKKLNINSVAKLQEESKQELKGYKACFIQNPVLAGFPTIKYGEFVDRYHASGLWIGYKFSKTNKVKLKDKFWATMVSPVNAEVLDKNYHLLAPPSDLGKIFTGFGYRQYLPASGKSYVGGLMATSGVNMFISGILNLTTGDWESKYEIDAEMKLMPNELNFVELANGHRGILLVSADQYKYLEVDEKGKKVFLTPLKLPKTGGKHNVLPTVKMKAEENEVLIFTETYESIGGKKVGVSYSRIKQGVEVEHYVFENDDLIAKQVLAKKEKLKLKKLKHFNIEYLKMLRSGDYLLGGYGAYDNLKGTSRAFMALHFTQKGELKASYCLEAIKPQKDERFSAKLAPLIIEVKNGFYWIERTEIHGYEKGVYSYTEKIGSTTRYTTLREDKTVTAGKVVRVNTNDISMSNAINIDGHIYGDRIGEISKNEHLFMSTSKGLLLVR